MLVVFFALWVVLNGRLTWEMAAFGAVISAAVYLFSCAFLGYSPKKDWAMLRRLPSVLAYAGLVLVEIVKANMALNRIVLGRREVKPKLVTFRTPLKGAAKAVLADSITLTPGTISVHVEGEELTVHCLDESFMEGVEDTSFQRALLRMERKEGAGRD